VSLDGPGAEDPASTPVSLGPVTTDDCVGGTVLLGCGPIDPEPWLPGRLGRLGSPKTGAFDRGNPGTT
jgi:hypothetical protein